MARFGVEDESGMSKAGWCAIAPKFRKCRAECVPFHGRYSPACWQACWIINEVFRIGEKVAELS